MTMNSELLANLPPEMQARIASMVAGKTAPDVIASGPPPQPQPMTQDQRAAANFGSHSPKQPSLMDHLLALRQEVDMMRQEQGVLSQQINSNSQVVDAVGQAVGQIYQMFQSTPNQGSTYSSEFQNQRVEQNGEDY